ncbi:hypothetical protein DRJ12_03420, partial [Candidatus Acetothermia bacterium]
ATKDDLKEIEDRLTVKIDANAAKIAGQNRMMKILTRLDQERLSTNARLDRVEADVEKNKREIERIKTKLSMP